MPAGKKAWQGPVVPLAAIVQLIPAGVEVIVPWPLPPGMIAIVPVAPDAGAGAAAGAGYGSCSILKLPFASLAPSATPSTVIVRFASAPLDPQLCPVQLGALDADSRRRERGGNRRRDDDNESDDRDPAAHPVSYAPKL